MNEILSDTTPEAQEIVYELMGRMPAWKKLKLTCEMIAATRRLVQADISNRFPDASQDELHRRFVARVLPRADVMRVYGFDPDEEGY